MRGHIAKNQFAYSIVLSMFQSIALGIYLAIYSDRVIKGSSLIGAFDELKRYNFLLVIVLILFFCQIIVGFWGRKHEAKNKERLINSILKAACNTLVYPRTELHIRAIITICDYKKGKRKTVYSYNIESDPERTAELDIDFGVTGQAIIRKIPVAEELPLNHVATYSVENGRYIAPDLKCVLAAPIFSINHPDQVIGVLAFDSVETLHVMQFDSRKSKEIAQMWADALSHLI
ncbi:MAG: hypothetical protein Q4D26_12820 [Clostridia bacterium]|nr:hypothetical protein [Clostridia bacterium]